MRLVLNSLFTFHLLIFYTVVKPNTDNKTAVELNRYAIDSHKEF